MVIFAKTKTFQLHIRMRRIKATRPLLRQIENLQMSHATQMESLENSERNLIER